MSYRPPKWPLVIGAVIEPRLAAALQPFLTEGRHRALMESWTVPKEVRELLDTIDNLAATYRGQAPTPEPERAWISAKEAAGLLTVSQRRVTQLVNEGKLRGRKRVWVWEIDAGDVVARMPSKIRLVS